ncbi:MAG: gamma-glutamyl-phosphate reductase, partial [Acidimicrobiaceae bacterium]|nr:gamma-glutamyl-phosphate reductase [Acidimicrobiaceae bacterium]
MDLLTDLVSAGERARRAARTLAQASSRQRNAALLAGADGLLERAEEILAANAVDLERAEAAAGSATVLDRLRLDESRIRSMSAGLRQVAALADPLGRVVAGWTRSDGLEIRKVTVPLGVIGIIYENRPNVTSDAASLCVKSGNAAFLRGSSGAISSNKVIAQVLRAGCRSADLPEDSVVL